MAMTSAEWEELAALTERYARRSYHEPFSDEELQRLVRLQHYQACEQRFVPGSVWQLKRPGALPLLVEGVGTETVKLIAGDMHSHYLPHAMALNSLVEVKE